MVILTLELIGAVSKMWSNMDLPSLPTLSLYLYVIEPNGVDSECRHANFLLQPFI